MTAPSLATTAPAGVAAQPRPAAPRPTPRTLRVLVVEDDPLTAQTFALALTRDGMDVDVCCNGLQAQERIEQCPPNAVVLDMSLPLRSGADLLRHLRAVGLRDLPVIVVSGADRQDFGLAHAELWPGAWVDKPLRPRDLVAVVREFLTDPR
ncbi:MAG: response regulator transcription factor [Planctomycetes bacterium]|nr:response regulator transcription factor [Planctomycetota bacterium]